MCRGFVLAAVVQGSSPGLGALCHVSLPPSLSLFPIISFAALSIIDDKRPKQEIKIDVKQNFHVV